MGINIKTQIRKDMKEKRARIESVQKDNWDQKIRNRILQLKEVKESKVVYCYMAFRTEIDMKLLIENLWKQGKVVAIPCIKGKFMVFYQINSLNDVTSGAYGILEPMSHCIVADDKTAPVITPGLAFTQDGKRIGYGGGYYDKFFQQEPHHTKIGVAYEVQVVSDFVTEAFDQRLDYVITPERMISMDLMQIGKQAKEASTYLNKLGITEKNEGLMAVAKSLIVGTDSILKANEIDVLVAKEQGMNPGLVDRLTLTPERIQGIADGLLEIVGLNDPIGEVDQMKQRPNGLLIGKKRVPLGVVGVIYEARPNVTADVFGLCFKTGNAVILKGGSDALESNKAIVACIKQGLSNVGILETAIQLIEDTDREVTKEFMKLNQYVDVLIPRGGAGLIRAVVENSTVPVIETGTGNCHIYVDETADFEMALSIIHNAKTQRIGVCNACESLVIHEAIAERFLPKLKEVLDEKQVEIRGDEFACKLVPEFIAATQEDWGTEYLDYIISVKIVKSIEDAIGHINQYNTGHSEAIITTNYQHAQQFLNEIDAAAVYVNASTRFTDGNEFGFGAEIGISTQKLHARGPMGLEALTTTKYIIYGNGQIR